MAAHHPAEILLHDCALQCWALLLSPSGGVLGVNILEYAMVNDKEGSLCGNPVGLQAILWQLVLFKVLDHSTRHGSFLCLLQKSLAMNLDLVPGTVEKVYRYPRPCCGPERLESRLHPHLPEEQELGGCAKGRWHWRCFFLSGRQCTPLGHYFRTLSSTIVHACRWGLVSPRPPSLRSGR